jgi:hypothetical protein
MYENGKMRPVETIPEMGKGGIKENDGGVNSTMIYCKNFCKCHNVPPNNKKEQCLWFSHTICHIKVFYIILKRAAALKQDVYF